jgi:phosphatidylserine/phosphatidylglycerophosphate/cardiolipin synthase-like enzyme
VKKLLIIILIIIFGLFSYFINSKNNTVEVIEILSPTEIVVDFNKNKRKDSNETIILKNIYSFSINNKKNYTVSKILNITNEDALRLGYLAHNYANTILKNNKILIKNDDIIINGNSYRKMLLNKGFATEREYNSLIDTNLKNARKINLVILNNKNNKYHKLNCKYGLLAKNIDIVPKSYISKSATPCKYCHIQKEKILNKNNQNFIKIDNMELYLTDMTISRKPNNNCEENMCKAIVKEINSSQKTIDMALYGYTKIPKIENALINAKNRGVKIRYVFDTDNNKNLYPDTLKLTNVVQKYNYDIEKSIMHNKFFIFDNKKVFTGSANLSTTDMSGFNSNASILIESENLAHIFKQEFEQMLNGKFHDKKQKINKDNNSNVKAYFSPADDIILEQIIPLIEKANKYIYIPAFVITHQKFTESLIKAKNRGIDVKIILDATNTKEPSQLTKLRAANIPVKTENYAGKLHSKSILIDDTYLILGSMNFSFSGAKYNDENTLIIQDKNLTKFYKNFFLYLWEKIPDKWLKYTARAESKDSIGSCSDGIDNDYDGDIDNKDTSCQLQK